MFNFAQNYLTRGFWGDEAWTSMISQLPYTQMLKTTAADFHPPGYYTIIEILYKFLPPTEVITRSVSITFYLLTALMVYKLASYIKDRTFGLIAALVVLLNPIFFTYAFEARNYTMFALFATTSTYFLIKLSKKFSKKDAILFVIFSTLGVYTHYYMFFTLAAQGFYILLFDRKIFWRMVILYSSVFVLFLPWIPFLYAQVTSVSQSYWIGGIDKRTHYEAFLRILGGEYENMFKFPLFVVSILLIVFGLVGHIIKRSFGKPYLLIWTWAFIPFVLASLPGLKIGGITLPFRPIFFWRYMIPAAIPLSLVIVHALQKMPPIVLKTSIATVIFLCLAINYLTFSRYPTTFREIYNNNVLPNISSEDKIVTVLPSFAEVFYYRNRNGLNNQLVVLPEGLVQFSGKSLLDAYNKNGAVEISDDISGRYFELRPGPNWKIINKK